MKLGSFNLLAVIVLLTATFVVLKWSDRRRPETLQQPLEAIGSDVDGWVFDATQPLSPETLRVLAPTSYLSRDYSKNHQHLGLFVAYYGQQRSGETMHSPKNCLPGAGWEIWKHELARVSSEGRSFIINEYFVRRAGERLIVYYWYQARDRIVANEYLGKFFLIRDAIMGGSTSGAFVRVTVLDDLELSQRASEFSAKLILQLESCFGRPQSTL